MGRPILRAPAGRAVSPLTGADLFTWMALRRVHGGYVAKLDSRYLDAGRPVPWFLSAAFDDLITAELVTVAESDLMTSGMRRLTATEAGRIRYTALCRREHQAALPVPAPQPGTHPDPHHREPRPAAGVMPLVRRPDGLPSTPPVRRAYCPAEVRWHVLESAASNGDSPVTAKEP